MNDGVDENSASTISALKMLVTNIPCVDEKNYEFL